MLFRGIFFLGGGTCVFYFKLRAGNYFSLRG